MIIKYNKKKVHIKNVKKLSEFGKGIGLMFHSREKCPAMLFEFQQTNNHENTFSICLLQICSNLD